MSDTLLARTVTDLARRMGDLLPAAYGMTPSEVLVTGDADSHAMPEGAPAVRWTLGDDDGFMVLALTEDAAQLLRDGPPEATLAEALDALLGDLADGLAPLFDGEAPAIGPAEELNAADALASGPGDAVSVMLTDDGVHRATFGLRIVVTDALLVPASADLPLPDASGSADAEGSRDLGDAAGDEGDGWDDAPEHAVGDDDGSTPAGDALPRTQAPSLVGGRGSAARRSMGGSSPLHAVMGDAHPADFASFDQLSALPGQPHAMSLLGDVEMGVTAELGRAELTVRDVLGLTPGSIIELDRAAGSPVDVVVNGTLIARGEVVVIDEEFGIRITEILGMHDEANPFPMAQ